MGTTVHLFLFILLRFISLSSAYTYNVEISTEQHANVVDARFLSFTIDPKYLFSSSEKYSSKECICMASSLTPAYLRIAGPSTAHMTFHNTTISINDVESQGLGYENLNYEITALDSDAPEKVPLHVQTRNLAVSHRQWKQFVHWANVTGFDLVFALNNEERTSHGMWDPNTALNILTVAEKVKVGDIFWELGYECTNQSIEEYLNDLETLRVIVETFPPRRAQRWKVVGGDVTKCLQADSKSDFKDYLTLSNYMMDALLLNGNSSYHELQRMTEHDRMKLIGLLTRSETPLWMTETNPKRYNSLERAADWLTSLGLSAKNGFAVHYRELEEEEMYEPTLSFYMALLFKNLVGERVLKVLMDPDESIIFAHCTSLRHKPVPGAVTLFAANMYDEPARFSLKLSRKEDGGDIMQFILGNDHNGNIVVNGRPMYYEGDIKPAVKRVHPYKTLIINLPPKSFGFWVLANTKIEACHNAGNKTLSVPDAISNEHSRVKRSINEDFDDYAHIADLSYDFEDTDALSTGNNALKNRINDMNRDLNKIQHIFKKNKDRFKRDDNEGYFRKNKLRKQGFRNVLDREQDHDFNPRRLIDHLLEKARQRVSEFKNLRSINRPRLDLNRISKRNPKNYKVRSLKPLNAEDSILENFKIHRKPKYAKKFGEKDDAFLKRANRKSKIEKNLSKGSSDTQEKSTTDYNLKKTSSDSPNVLEAPVRRRKRRSVNEEIQEISAENEIDLDEKDKAKLWKILMKLNKEFGDNSEEKVDTNPDSPEGIILKTEVSDDSATIKVHDSNHGVIKSTMKSMLHVLEDLNKNLNKVWSAINLLD